MKKLFTIAYCLIVIVGQAQAQQPLSNKRMQLVKPTDTLLLLDSLLILPESVVVLEKETNKIISKEAYQVINNTLVFSKPIPQDSLQIQYRVLALNLQKPIAHLDTNLIRKTYKGDYIGFDYGSGTPSNTASLLNNSGLTYSGSFARGVSFGNSQDLVLNSSFNLQIAGDLGDDTQIVAALTDENIPLQAEGNTQQLNDFDKIFIKIKRPNTSLTAGDYELANPKGYFSRYYKKLQGATFEGNWDFSTNNLQLTNETDTIENGQKILKTQASVAIARGKFARNNLIPQEGNQGPYKLTGNQGEQFIIILSGTEKIYMDGQLLTRGIEADYIIDYNRGELTFTNRRLITKDRRIITEIEYVDQTFQRSLYAINAEYETAKWRLYANVFSQQDSRNAIGDAELSEEQQLQLQTVGDNLQAAFSSSIRAVEDDFNLARIQYELRDTSYISLNPSTNTTDTSFASVLVFSTNPATAIYTAQFAELGFGNGNYIQIAPSGANGRVFEWIAPNELGIPQGNFEPIQQVKAPEKQQLYTFGTEYDINKYSSIQLETAISNKDLNRLSDRDEADNIGTALLANYQLNRPLGDSDWTLESAFKYEFVQKDFQALNPYRSAEFNRDWNIGLIGSVAPTNEHIGKGGIHLRQGEKLLLEYDFSGFLRTDLYEGAQHEFLSQYTDSGYDLKVYGSLLTTTTDTEQTQFFRPRIDFSKTFKKLDNWRIGVYGEREKNERILIPTDSLSAASFHWDLYKIYLEKPAKGKFAWHINYLKRYDYAPNGKRFLRSTTANELNLNGQWQYQRGGQLKWVFSYRNLAINNTDLTTEEARATYLGRLDYNLQLWRGAFRWHTNYEIGAGQEAKTEFQFIRVNTGEGNFVWNPTEMYDLNGDSIPQINEFVIAPFQDQANFIRINTFTNDFIRTNNVLLNQSLHLTPRAIWHNKEGWKKTLAKFATLSTLRINRKVQAVPDISVWNPFNLNIADTALVSIASNIRNVLYFNQQHPVYDMQLGHFDTRNRNILTTGFESRQTAEQFFRARWTMSKALNTITNVALGKRTKKSELFGNQDFNIEYYRISPMLVYVPTPQWEASCTYRYQRAKNTLVESFAKARFHDLKFSLQYNQTQKTALRSELSFVQIALDGTVNPSLELALLEGLQDGQNFLWNLTMDRQLANNVQLSLRYEGRKTGTRNVVHVGSMQVRASF